MPRLLTSSYTKYLVILIIFLAGLTFFIIPRRVFSSVTDAVLAKSGYNLPLVESHFAATQGTLTPILFFDGSGDSRFFGASFGEPVIDSQGRLLVSTVYTSFNCNFGICDNKLSSLSPAGTLNWLSPGLSSAPSAFNHVLVGPKDRAYMLAGNNRIFAFDAAGNIVPGWPVTLPYAYESQRPVVIDQTNGEVYVRTGLNFSYSRFPDSLPGWPAVPPYVSELQRPAVTDQTSQEVYAKTGLNFSYSGFPVAVTAFHPDGSQIWRTEYSDGNPGGSNLLQGPGRNLYTYIYAQGTVNLAHSGGTQLCHTAANIGGVAGDSDGIFFGGAGITAIKGDCSAVTIYTAGPGAHVEVEEVDQARIFAIDYPNNPFDGEQLRLFAISKKGSFLWRNNEISIGSVRAIKDGILYVLGKDANDDTAKLFMVDASTGQTVNSVKTDPACGSCGVAVADDGTIYLNDLGSTKIYKLGSNETPTPTPTPTPTETQVISSPAITGLRITRAGQIATTSPPVVGKRTVWVYGADPTRTLRTQADPRLEDFIIVVEKIRVNNTKPSYLYRINILGDNLKELRSAITTMLVKDGVPVISTSFRALQNVDVPARGILQNILAQNDSGWEDLSVLEPFIQFGSNSSQLLKDTLGFIPFVGTAIDIKDVAGDVFDFFKDSDSVFPSPTFVRNLQDINDYKAFNFVAMRVKPPFSPSFVFGIRFEAIVDETNEKPTFFIRSNNSRNTFIGIELGPNQFGPNHLPPAVLIRQG